MFLRVGLSSISLSLVFWMSASAVQAQQFERPPAYNTAKLLGARAAGPNYTIDSPTVSDGYLNVYQIRVKKGRYRVEGDELLRNRLYELQVLQKLDQMSQGGQLVEGVGTAVVAPVKYAGRVVTAPVKTVGQTISGVGSFFGRMASGIGNVGSSPEGTVSSVLGVSGAKRELAKKFGVDPYTDFKPLASRMSDLAGASAIGQLTVKVPLSLASGGAATAISGVSTLSSVRSMIYEKTASQVRDINRSKLQAMGVDGKTINRLLNNKRYTVTDRAVMIGALEQLRGVGGRALFVARAAQAKSRGIAFFQRKRAEHLASYHQTKGQLRSFISLAGFPLTQTRSGRVLALFPLDSFTWTKKNARIITAITEDIRRKNLGTSPEFRTTGWATPLAEKMLKSQGWRVSHVYGS